MKKTVLLQIRVTPDQHEKLKYEAKMHGFKSLSAYMRHLAMNVTLNMEQKINAIYTLMKMTRPRGKKP